MSSTLRCGFVNIHSGVDANGDSNRIRLARWAIERDLDVLGLVEVEGVIAEGTVDWLADLARECNLDRVAYSECLAFDFRDSEHGTFGNAVLSRFPIRVIDEYLLTPESLCWDGETPETEPRKALAVQVSATDPYGFVVTHFPYGSDSEGRRHASRVLCQRLSDLSIPYVLAGDFNADLRSTDLVPLKSLGLSRSTVQRPTYPTHRPEEEIDLVLSKGLQVDTYHVDESAIFSDHLPVYAIFQNLRPPAR